jgi:hypothetical protein
LLRGSAPWVQGDGDGLAAVRARDVHRSGYSSRRPLAPPTLPPLGATHARGVCLPGPDGAAGSRDDDSALRDDFKFLGRILGETLTELHGPGALTLVEEMRRSAVALRRGRLSGGRSTIAASLTDRSLEELGLPESGQGSLRAVRALISPAAGRPR